jgi:hypothetical protein
MLRCSLKVFVTKPSLQGGLFLSASARFDYEKHHDAKQSREQAEVDRFSCAFNWARDFDVFERSTFGEIW